jgi:type 1 glutamine amidotransferase
MRKIILITALFVSVIALSFTAKKTDKVLIFSLTKGYHHASISEGITAIKLLGQQNDFLVDTTTNPAMFTNENLKQYKALIFLSPTGNGFFNKEQQTALMNYMHNGGGFVGIHAATDCLYDWPWYGKLVGAYFSKHPKVQQAKLIVNDRKHISTKDLQAEWIHTDEWYNFKEVNPNLKVLISLDETSYKGGDMNNNHPIAWYHKYEGGKVFYTGLGHTKENYTTDSLFLKHLTGGIKYALGRKK